MQAQNTITINGRPFNLVPADLPAPVQLLTHDDTGNIEYAIWTFTLNLPNPISWQRAIWQQIRERTGTAPLSPLCVHHLPAIGDVLRNAGAQTFPLRTAMGRIERRALRYINAHVQTTQTLVDTFYRECERAEIPPRMTLSDRRIIEAAVKAIVTRKPGAMGGLGCDERHYLQ